MSNKRETTIRMMMLAEKSSNKVCGNGVGLKLLTDFYAGEASWYSFTESEQRLIAKTVRDFGRRLQETELIDGDAQRETRP